MTGMLLNIETYIEERWNYINIKFLFKLEDARRSWIKSL